MLRKSTFWSVILVSIVAVAFLATGCQKAQVIKEEATAKPASVMEAKKEEFKPAPPKEVEKPREEAKVEPPPVPTPKEEAKPEPKVEAAPPAAPKAAALDLASLRIQFAFDDFTLATQSREKLEKIGTWMAKSPGVKIQIEGHTCDLGTAEYNLALGERRANSAKTYLEGLGIPSTRLSTISYGEERPLVPNKNEDERSKNRRDDFVEIK